VQALSWNGASLELLELPEPEPAADEAVVRVRLAGICRTDLEIVRGYMGFRGVLGHELVGVVEQGSGAWLGRRVVAEINAACGSCDSCRRGLDRHCPTRRVLGIAGAQGVLAERVAVPERSLHLVPEGVPDDAAVFCEPLAAAFEVLEQVSVAADTTAFVLGDGKLGLLVAMALARAGAQVRLVGHHASHLELVRPYGVEPMLLDANHLPTNGDASGPDAGALAAAVARITDGMGRADLVVEATGRAGGLALALAVTRPRGSVVLKSTVADRISVDMAPVVIDELTLLGSRCGPFPPALDALERGTIDPRPLIAARYPLSRALDAFAHALQPGTLKVLVECG
jgi:threonine dehydrogenase-like Zn-dependent dehydrogenase